MTRFLTAASFLAILAACDSEQPLNFGEVESPVEPDTTEQLDPLDPNTDVNDVFDYDFERGLTLNAVSYDADNDVVVINNLPFDGPSGGYDFVRDLGNGLSLYRSRTTATTGLLTYYAVFDATDNLSVTAANGRDWGDFGYGGSNVNRSSFGFPEGADNTVPDGTPDVGEYLYTGGYAGLRSLSDRGGIEIVDGQIQLLVDINDVDPDGVTQGSVLATVFARTSRDESGGFLNNLPNIALKRVNFDSTNGTFSNGEAETFDYDGRSRDTGNYQGMIAGSSGTEVGGTLTIEGVANIQNVVFETVTYEVSETVTETFITIDPLTGLPISTDVDRIITTTGSYAAINDDTTDAIQAIIDAGRIVPTQTVTAADLPPGAVITASEFSEQEFVTDFEAREIGGFITIQQ